MEEVPSPKIQQTIPFVMLIALFALSPVKAQDGRPVADAGSSRYADTDPVLLDGTGSYDPDNSGTLSYTWRQISGPVVVITDANTTTPTISGFVQTEDIQECEFELTIRDGQLTSLPDTVKVIIVPDFGANTLVQTNPPFDRNKPTLIYFGGGDCTDGSGYWGGSTWRDKANIISPPYYSPDSYVGGARTYYKYGDMIIAYLSSVAPDYKQPIQTSGYSTGGQPAVDVGIRLNLTYADTRYAVNRVTFLDATSYCRENYSESITAFLGSSVDGEQCWADAYVSTTSGGVHPVGPPFFHESVLNVWFPTATGSWLTRHELAPNWYRNSLEKSDMNQFNNGVVAGAYWSVTGPGKNLQLASTPNAQTYKFQWYGDASSGYMDFYDEPNHPGRLPRPVTLVEPSNGTIVDGNGTVFSCEVSENAVGYKLLFGRDPYHMVYLFSDTPFPLTELVTTFPFEQCWWTVMAYDQYGSTIYADPMHFKTGSVSAQTIENAITGQTYASIHQALNDAHPGDEIVVGSGSCQYLENINFKGKNLTVRSIDPNDPSVVAATVINGGHQGSAVTFSGGEEASCVLDGFTITGGIIGISCRDASPTIKNCTIGSPGSTAIEFWDSEPRIIDCTILGNVIDHSLVAYWRLDEEVGDIAYDSVNGHDATLHGTPLWQPDAGRFAGALEFDGIDSYGETDFILNPAIGSFSSFAWIKGGAPGHVMISQTGGNGGTWIGIGNLNGNLMTGLAETYFGVLESGAITTDGLWHQVGLVYDFDALKRRLYVDGVRVAEDATFVAAQPSNGGLHIGTSKDLGVGTFLSGSIDDIRIYNRALSAEEIAALAH